MTEKIEAISHVNKKSAAYLENYLDSVEQLDPQKRDERNKDSLLPAEKKPEVKLSGTTEKKKIEEAVTQAAEVVTPGGLFMGWCRNLGSLVGICEKPGKEAGSIAKADKGSGNYYSKHKPKIRAPHSDDLENLNALIEETTDLLKDEQALRQLQDFMERNIDQWIYEVQKFQATELAEGQVELNKLAIQDSNTDIQRERNERLRKLEENLQRAKDNKFWGDLRHTATITSTVLGAAVATASTIATGGAVSPLAIGLWLSVGVSIAGAVDMIAKDAAKRKVAQVLAGGSAAKEDTYFQRIKTVTELIVAVANLVSLVGGTVGLGGAVSDSMKAGSMITGGSAVGVNAINTQKSEVMRGEITLHDTRIDVRQEDLKNAMRRLKDAYASYVNIYGDISEAATREHFEVRAMLENFS